MLKIKTSLVKDILTKRYEENMSVRDIERAVPGATRSTISRKLQQFENSGLKWDDVKNLSEDELEEQLSPGAPHFVAIPHEEVHEYLSGNRKRTLEGAYDQLYKEIAAKEGERHYGYSRFCELHSSWLAANTGYRAVSVIPCEPGDFLEIDFSGDVLHWRDATGENRTGHVFVASLRYSKMVFAEVFDNEKAVSWLKGTVDAVTAFGGTTKAVTMDNARALVGKPDEYVGQVTAAVNNLCEYYQMQPHTCPIMSPRRKQSAEYAASLVQSGPQLKLVGTGGLAYAANLEELNARLAKQVDELNLSPWTNGACGCRRSLFESAEKSRLRPLPLMPYEPTNWTVVTASIRYLAVVDRQAYMVNWTEAGKKVAVSLSSTEVRFYSMDDFRLVGRYERDYGPYRVHVDQTCMSPADLALRRGYDGVAESFAAKGYAREHVLLFLKTLFDNEALPQMTKVNIVGALRKLCDRHGAGLVDNACEWAQRHGFLHMYPRVRARVLSLANQAKVGGAS